MQNISDDHPASLLTIDAVCSEFNLERWQVLRLISRSNLAAAQVGGDQWRIVPDALTTAMNRTTDFEGPAVRSGWLDVRAEQNRALRFRRQIESLIEENIPETDPGRDQNIQYTGAIRAAGTAAPASLMIRLADQPALPYMTQADVYAAVEIVNAIHRELRSQRIRIRAHGPQPGSMLERMYRTPESYTQAVAAAWDRFLNGRIAFRKTYPNGETRTFSLRNADIQGVDRNEIARLAL